MTRFAPASVLPGLVVLSVGAGLAQGAPAPAKAPVKPPVGGKLSPADAAALEERFTKEIWPLLDRASGGCVACHDGKSPSTLRFPTGGASAGFKKLFGEGFLDPENPSGLLARITTPDKDQRMPPAPAPGWTDAEADTLRSFLKEVYDRSVQGGRADEHFPAELLDPYTGKPVPPAPDTTFLSYTQLKGKVRTLFGDDWNRGAKDLFAANVAQFNGADFKERFDESSKASATFLSALDSMTRDVASRAYLTASGPFAGRSEKLAPPAKLKAPDAAYRAEIARLYRTLLFRSPSEVEVQQAFGLLKSVYGQAETLAREPGNLDLELVVEDEAGRRASHPVRLPFTHEDLGAYQEWVDQSQASETPQVRHTLRSPLTFRPDSPGQRLELSNEATTGNVSFAGLELKGPLPETTVQKIEPTAPGVDLQGAWQQRTEGGFTSFEDGNNSKGRSRIEVPIRVTKPGRYEVTLVWRKPGTLQLRRNRVPQENAAAVPVQVRSHDRPVSANPPLPAVPPKGEARFTVDQTVDTLRYWELLPAFRFSEQGGVEINNLGTKRRVVADSVKFVPAAPEAKELLLDDPQAEGGWPATVPPTRFRPFNQVGTGSVSDNNNKQEMRLLYRPAKAADWQAGQLYRVHVGFPGFADNETRTPVIVRAEESTPIIQMSRPLRADTGMAVTLDASATYNVQGGPLKFTWVQHGGPKVRFSDPHAAKTTFTVAPMGAEQAAWEGLCRALMTHPDFLFTRPRSLAAVTDARDRRRLQLVKIAQDLVGRPPTEAEVKQLDAGAPLSKLVDQYLDGQEFRDFYFRRVRLLLESRGGDADDEPVRLWCYVAFNDRPFKEILTADYTVDAQLRKQDRPAYHGKTGLLTMKGFIKGKPGLPHFNYAALVTEKFLGYVYEVPPSVVAMRDGITAVATTSPTSACYSCHKVLTPLAYQRMAWDDDGNYKPTQGSKTVDDTDRGLVPSYPYRGKGMEAFALQAVNKERFLRTILQTHFVWYFGREMRHAEDERGLYKKLWDNAHQSNFSLRAMLRTLMTSPEYLNAGAAPTPPRPTVKSTKRTAAHR